MIRDPRVAFDMLFGTGGTEEERTSRRQSRSSILDWITDEVAALERQLGGPVEFVLVVLYHSILPALSIVIASLGWWFLSMRSMIITVKGEDFILMAYAKGLREKTIMWKYAFRNAILPQTTGLAISLSHIVGGALLTEVIFAYPGIGWLIYTAITSLDYPVIQGSVLLVIVAVALANYMIDMVYPLIDPRIRYGGG
jgi:peptide/nickel transport system permease protein